MLKNPSNDADEERTVRQRKSAEIQHRLPSPPARLLFAHRIHTCGSQQTAILSRQRPLLQEWTVT